MPPWWVHVAVMAAAIAAVYLVVGPDPGVLVNKEFAAIQRGETEFAAGAPSGAKQGPSGLSCDCRWVA